MRMVGHEVSQRCVEPICQTRLAEGVAAAGNAGGDVSARIEADKALLGLHVRREHGGCADRA